MKVRRVMMTKIRCVQGLRKIHTRRRARILEEHREIERRVREEVEAEMEALRLQLQQEAQQEAASEAVIHHDSSQPSIEPLTEDAAKRAREAGVARTVEVKDIVHNEHKRQIERMEARLAQRRRRLHKQEATIVMNHQREEARVELNQRRESLQAKPVSQVRNRTLMKDLHKVNNIIAGLTGSSTPGSRGPSAMGPGTNSASVSRCVSPRTKDTPAGLSSHPEAEESDEEV